MRSFAEVLAEIKAQSWHLDHGQAVHAVLFLSGLQARRDDPLFQEAVQTAKEDLYGSLDALYTCLEYEAGKKLESPELANVVLWVLWEAHKTRFRPLVRDIADSPVSELFEVRRFASTLITATAL